MSRAKVIIAAFIAALAISAVGSAAASASTAGWMVNGTLLSGSKPLATTAAVMKTGVLTFSTVTVECTGETLNGIAPAIESSNKGSATSLEFTACKTPTGSKCELVGTKVNTLPITVEATLSGTLGVRASFSPKTGTLFTTLLFKGASCAIAEEVQPVTGKANVLGPTGQDERASQEIVATALTAGELKVGSSAATLAGAALLRLASGESWSFL